VLNPQNAYDVHPYSTVVHLLGVLQARTLVQTQLPAGDTALHAVSVAPNLAQPEFVGLVDGMCDGPGEGSRVGREVGRAEGSIVGNRVG
jgi:hypothetical protein